MKIKLTGLSMSGYLDVHPCTSETYKLAFYKSSRDYYPILKDSFNIDECNGKILTFAWTGKYEYESDIRGIRIYELVDIE
jgi:hypothetical protein